MDNYNNSYHSTIKNNPSNLIKGKEIDIENAQLNTIMKNLQKEPDLISIRKNDWVRVRLDIFTENKKNIFMKKYVPNYSKEIYKFIGESRNLQPLYRLKNDKNEVLTKRFYNDDLLKIDKDKLIKPNSKNNEEKILHVQLPEVKK